MSDTYQSSKPAPSPTYAVASTIFGAFDRSTEQRKQWGLMFMEAKACLSQGRLADGVTLTSECLRLARTLFPEPATHVIACDILLGQLYCASLKHDLAINSFEGALNLCRSEHSDLYTKLTILGHIAAVEVATGKSLEAIGTYEKRLALVSDAPHKDDTTHALMIETLKELSALCLKSAKLDAAEKHSYELAQLQERGLERGKTLLLLAQIYRANGSPHFARDTAVQAQQELLSGGADHYEPLALATAYRLEARLLFERKLYELAREKYDLARSIFCSVLGQRNLHTVLCGCDISVVNMHLETSAAVAASLHTRLDQAISLSEKGSNEPSLRPYILSSASLEHKLGLVMHAALAAIEELVEHGDITLSSVSRKLQKPGLNIAWRSIFTEFPRGVDRQTLLPYLTNLGQKHCDTALKRYIQLVTSLQNQFGVEGTMEVADVYDRMSSVHYILGNAEWGKRYEDKADLIRSKHENRPGGNQR